MSQIYRQSRQTLFLLYSPLNQGLKQKMRDMAIHTLDVFTLQSIKSRIETWSSSSKKGQQAKVFTLQSIKSRIETGNGSGFRIDCGEFLLYSPLNQGLKPKLQSQFLQFFWVFTLQSIKSRIETFWEQNCQGLLCQVFTLQSIKSRIETQCVIMEAMSEDSFYSTVH